jgi:hypothetical protein
VCVKAKSYDGSLSTDLLIKLKIIVLVLSVSV